ncbi:MAG: enoyl-CoA hydratase-related protein [Acidimicrobiales bacterium]|jgi:enoyl-CoA hydratase/carnithine racemase|nr:enoyl-CoA hydratase-related protein [Acidimicrobiales bacterium]MDP6213674.1 enoyl-CoA hydratase-related protein [Acidimicrobiales bacterium]MDP7209501.1 enoyl-CoA hydratase-related protein [Acidimicrobiales bacterium]HJO98349.1 enoyl-CoA hydratase-related protein [Acidimicrobiales bacterium]|tara:strand:+ start:5658 stop:6437 length:780 start_codon:yes stop_codon:yes gene_type:complete
MDYEHLCCECDGEIVTITLSRPDRRNCLSTQVLMELEHAVRSTGEQDDVAGLVLASTGPVFSSGHDLAEMAAMTEDELRNLFDVCSAAMKSLAEVPQVVIAQVQGLATAAGAQLAASADLIVASDEARFATPGGKGGLFCHTPMVAVARQIGRKRAAEMALTGGAIDATTALQWGLVNRVVPVVDLEQSTRDFMGYATRGSRYAKGLGKATMYAQMDMTFENAYELAADVMSRAAAHGDGREWPTAFVEKRRPEWSHEG